MVTSSEDGTVKIWDTRTGGIQRNYTHGTAVNDIFAHVTPVNDVVIHPNQGELISCDRGGNIRVWDLSEDKCTHQLIPEEDVSIASVTVASDGTMLCAGTNTVSLSGKKVFISGIPTSHTYSSNLCFFSPWLTNLLFHMSG